MWVAATEKGAVPVAAMDQEEAPVEEDPKGAAAGPKEEAVKAVGLKGAAAPKAAAVEMVSLRDFHQTFLRS